MNNAERERHLKLWKSIECLAEPWPMHMPPRPEDEALPCALPYVPHNMRNELYPTNHQYESLDEKTAKREMIVDKVVTDAISYFKNLAKPPEDDTLETPLEENEEAWGESKGQKEAYRKMEHMKLKLLAEYKYATKKRDVEELLEDYGDNVNPVMTKVPFVDKRCKNRPCISRAEFMENQKAQAKKNARNCYDY